MALDPTVPGRVVDLRFALVPNEIDPPWGIDLDADAPPDTHVGYSADRAGVFERIGAWWRIVAGDACGRRHGSA